MPGPKIFATCARCGTDFTSRSIMIGGQTKWPVKWCDACLKKSQEEVEQQVRNKFSAERLDLLENEWKFLCPELYRKTDVNYPSMNQKALSEIMAWEDTGEGIGLAIRGDSGKCKTRMAYLLLQKLHMRGRKTVFAITATRLAALCAEIYSDSEGTASEARKTTRKVRGVSYLLIDDLGKQKFTERAETELYDLIETRTSNLLPTFWTANVTSDAFAKMMSEDRAAPIIRRLSEFSKVINL